MMSWASIGALVLLSWVGVALAIGTIIGHGIAFGTGGDVDDEALDGAAGQAPSSTR